MMQGLRRYPNDIVRLDLTPTPSPSPTATTTMSSSPPTPSSSSSCSLSIDAVESAETKIQRLISEHPVIIFSRSPNSCYTCQVIKNLLASIGVYPTVIELDDNEISALPAPSLQAPPDDNCNDESNCSSSSSSTRSGSLAPSVFIGGTCVGGFESLVALHLSGHLVPKLVEVGAL